MDDLRHNENLLIRYLDGELPAEEKAMLEQRLQTDAALQQQLENLRVSIQAIRQYGAAQQVHHVHAEMMAELKGAKQGGKVRTMNRSVRYALAIAASVLVVLIGAQLYFSSQVSSDKLYQQAFVDFSVSASRGNDATTSETELLYQQKKYEAVVNAPHARQLDAKDSLLIGLSYLHIDKTTEASGLFTRVANYSNEYQQDAEYYLAMSYLKMENYKQALPLIQKIAASTTHIYHGQFDGDFLKKVEKLAKK